MDGIRTGFVDGTYQVVVSDMTAFWAAGRYWELTLYTDLWNDEIVGWSLSSRKGDVSTYFNEERPMCCLGYLTPKQYRLEYEKSHVASITDSTCLRLPTVVSTYR
jgi:transposase InsO family protein